MSDALHGYGTVIKLGDGASPEVFTDLAEVTKITPPGPEVETIDVTHLTSPDATKEFIAGLISPGEVSLEMNFIPAGTTFSTLKTALESRAIKNFKIVFSDDSPSSEVDFSGLVKTISTEVPLDDRMTATVSIQVSGLPVWS